MAYDIGVRLGVDGEKAFRSSINAINANIKSMGSELKAVTAQFAKNADSEEALTAKNAVLAKSIAATKEKIGVLDKQLERQAEKLRDLGKALDEVVKAHGADSKEALEAQNAYNKQVAAVAKLQDQLNGAKAELAGMENAVKDNRDAIDGLGREVEDAGDAMEEMPGISKRFGDGLKAGIVAAAKAAAAAVAALGAATIALTKSSIDVYSDYEQLVGGVETLFKDSSGQVQEYAQNAFKTAGLSANEYMDTVTSFSASLLQGLQGDTAKAADLANLAITDMADNANKMGTDMASIQYAYQGFAKQNYTMLDNLKLSYGGTQEEMIRLINDSGVLIEKIESLDNVTFDQIIEAIHEVQTQIGITGTTAKEAESTIQGSTAAMKSAWDNLKIGLASGDQDMGKLVSDFTSSIETAASNILPRIGVILKGIGPMIGEFLKQGLVKQIPDIILSGKDFVVSLVSGMTEELPNLQEAVGGIVQNLSQYIRDNLPAFVSSGLELLSGLASSIREGAGVMVDAGIQLVTSLAQGLANSFPTIIEKLPGIVSDIAGVINDNAPKILAAGVNIVVTLGKGLIQAIPTLVKNLPQIVLAIVDVFNAFNWLNLGKTIINKLGDGIKGMAGFVKNSASQIKDTIKNKIAELPSELFNIGKDMIKKLWDGISSLAGWIKDKAASLVKSIAGSISGGMRQDAANAAASAAVTGRSAAAPAMLAAAADEEPAPVLFRAAPANTGASLAQSVTRSLSNAESQTQAMASIRRVQRDMADAGRSAAAYYTAPERRSAGNPPAGNAGNGADAAAIGKAVREALDGAKVVMDGRTVGRLTTIQQDNMGRALGTL